jgi:hypothetical protein
MLRKAFEHLTSEINYLRKEAPDLLRLASEYEKLAKSLAAAAWLRAKVGVFTIVIEFQQRDDVYEMVV